MYSDYYNDTIGVILSCAILYDFLFRSSISFNMLFLEEIWSRNFTNLFAAPLKISEIIVALTSTALLRTLIGIVPAIILMNPLFGVSLLKMGPALFLLFFKFISFRNNIGSACYIWTIKIWACFRKCCLVIAFYFSAPRLCILSTINFT